MSLTMHENLPKIVAKTQTSKQDSTINLSYNGHKALLYGTVVKKE